MSNHSNQSGEMPTVALVCALASVVGVLILVQLFRAKPLDLPSILIIAVCFVVAVIGTALWSNRSGG